MAWIGQIMLGFTNWYNNVNALKKSIVKNDNALKFGVLSAAAINYVAFFDPVATHPDAVVAAIGARDKKRAQAQIDSNGLGAECKAYGSYEEVVNDPRLDAIYIPLPTGLHAEWAIKAMKAGKHVLIEKPIASNAEEARQIAQTSQETGKVALEAFHFRLHPANHFVKSLITSGKYGEPIAAWSRLTVITGAMGPGDIRFQYPLAGGACLDLGYVFSSTSLWASQDLKNTKITVDSYKNRINAKDKRVEEAVDVHFTLQPPGGKPAVKCHVEADLNLPPLWGLVPRWLPEMPSTWIELEKARIDMQNFVVPTFGHKIVITPKDESGNLLPKKKFTETPVYTDGPWWKKRGEPWWTTYRYQLEAFVEAIRKKEKGEEYEGPWVPLEDSEKVIEVIDAVYDKMNLPRRGLP